MLLRCVQRCLQFVIHIVSCSRAWHVLSDLSIRTHVFPTLAHHVILGEAVIMSRIVYSWGLLFIQRFTSMLGRWFWAVFAVTGDWRLRCSPSAVETCLWQTIRCSLPVCVYLITYFHRLKNCVLIGIKQPPIVILQ